MSVRDPRPLVTGWEVPELKEHAEAVGTALRTSYAKRSDQNFIVYDPILVDAVRDLLEAGVIEIGPNLHG